MEKDKFNAWLRAMIIMLLLAPMALCAQNVKFTGDAMTLKSAIAIIEKQAGVSVEYNNAAIDVNRVVRVKGMQGNVSNVMRRLLVGTGYVYEIKGKHVIITRGQDERQTVSQQSGKTHKVRGRITDANGDPIIGATITDKSTGQKTVTDIDGNYDIAVSDDHAKLVVSYIGFSSKEMSVNDKSVLNASLSEDTQGLNEVVVIGYGVQKKVNLTGSVAAVDAKTIENIPTANLSNALAGRLSGVNITQTAGKPGGGSSLTVRATGTWNNSSPLYVIDGVVRDKFTFDGLDASEVENISVLKDGASAAIYGSRAANGVVLVTTKKGASGKPTINYIGSVGISDATQIPDMFNAYQQAVYINNSLKNQNISENDTRYYADDELEYFKEHSYDWIDMTWRDPIIYRNSVNVSGGNDRVKYFLGGNYYYETGSFDNLNYRKYSIRSNVEAKITNNLTASLNINTDTRKDRKPYWTYDYDNDNMNNLYNGLLRRGIFAPYINGKPNGTYLKWSPMEVIDGASGYNRKKYTTFDISASLSYDVPFVKGLNLKLTFDKYQRHTFIKQFSQPYDLYVFKTTGTHGHIQTDEFDHIYTRNDGNFLYENYQNDESYQLDFMVNYHRTFGKHDITGLLVYEQYEGTYDYFDGQRKNFISSAVDQLFAGGKGASDKEISGSGSETGRLSYVGRLGYIYADKYLFDASFRYDGSVNFAPGHRWGFFPSFSGAWRISEENFFKKNIKFIDYMKLRASVGLLGNDSVGGWQWMQSYNITTGAYFGLLSNGVRAGVIPNEDITWEKSLDVDYGVDLRFLQNKLSLSIGGFYKHTYDILGSRIASLPTTFGGSMPSENYATIDTHGYEIELGYDDKIGNDISYHIGGNLGYAVNKLKKMDEAENIRPYQSQLNHNTDRAMGYICTGMIRTQEDLDKLPEGFTILGQKPELGMLLFKDIRGADSDEPDGKIDSNDQDWVIKHTVNPYNFGISLGFKWKDLSLDLFMQGRAGGKRFYDQRTEWADIEASSYAFRADYWTPENTNAKYPRAGYDESTNATSTFWIQNTSYMRMKNINFSYMLPKQWISKIGLGQVKVFFQGSNLFFLYRSIKDYDPENVSITDYPLMKNYTFGVNVSF